MIAETAKFADALASVETLSVEDQAALIEVVNKRDSLLGDATPRQIHRLPPR